MDHYGRVLTIGHSTRPLEEFAAMVKAHGGDRIVDIRTVPRSRHNPQYNRDTLPASLHALSLGYHHIAALGGLRHSRAGSVNTGWRNLSFRGFADYMQTEEFETALNEFIVAIPQGVPVLMCAEAVPWRCHRSLVADALVVHKVPVFHIMGMERADPHHLNPMARVEDGRITYPGPEPERRQDSEQLSLPEGS